MLNVPVVLLVVAVAVLVGVVAVALGHGGELAYFPADYAPLKLDQVTSTDVALFRPPTALWGYSMQATDEALSRIASTITERDIEISALQQQVADLQAAALYRPPARPEPETPEAPGNAESSGPASPPILAPAPSWLPRAARPTGAPAGPQAPAHSPQTPPPGSPWDQAGDEQDGR